MIHQYRNNGYNIVMDVYSGSVHVVDDVCYDVIAKLSGSETEPTAGSLKETGVKIDTKKTTVNIDSKSGMAGRYSTYDSSLSLSGIPAEPGTYPVSVTVTDESGRTVTSNELTFKVYSTNEKLADHIARAKEMKPSVLFLSYGMNDVGAQNGDADGFIKAYRPVIRDLKKSLPDTKIYVNSILPTAQIAIDQNSVYAKISEFNQKLKKLCEKEKVTFIDNTELVKQEYYAGDGIHMSTGYYKEWVNHMAEVAEL